jgi:hypothetical protein
MRMERTGSGRFSLWIFFFALLVTNSVSGQTRRGYPTPPDPAQHDKDSATPGPNHSIHLDHVAIERESKELAALAATIPGDIEQMKKGLLPGDTFDKLKRIEKLSRQLREHLKP